MKNRIAISILLSKACFGAFSVCVPVTIDHTKVPNTDQTDFAIPVCANGNSGAYCDAVNNANLSSPSFKQLASGGKSLNASGFDINWFSDATCTSAIPFYFVAAGYVGTTGFGQWYVKKTLLTASDVTIYAGIGDASITTNQSSNAWASTFKAVWPFGGVEDLTGPVVAAVGIDATGNGFNLSAGSGSPPTSTEVGINKNGITLRPGSSSGTSNNDQPVHVLASGLPTGTSDRTLIFYSSSETAAASATGFAFGMGQHSAHKAFDVRATGATCALCCGTGNLYAKRGVSIQCNADDVTSAVGYCLNQGDPVWSMHQYVFKLSSTGSVMDLYVDGALDTHSTGHACNTDITGNGQYASWNTDGDCTPFGCANGDTGQQFLYGKIADTALSADYIATENNAVSSPQTFLTFGSPIPLGSSVRHRVIQ